jgi:hypothetical protein
MNIWLDDMRGPDMEHQGFQWVRTYEEVIAWLEADDVVKLSLDHDLGGEKTGFDVLKWLADRPYSWPCGRVDVHSMNPVAKEQMCRFIDDFEARRNRNEKDSQNSRG